jgi:tetratricopeptide (TPR) repeat protein
LGDITKDITYYKKAWKASNKRYARAQRSLARQYYNKGDMEKSRKAFEKSLGVNEYQATCWFTLGFVYMRLDLLDKAITAFAKCVQLDETQSLAWANLSGIFMKQGRMHEAFTTISQAAQRRERDAKIWYNFMMVSFQAQKYPSFIKSINT